MTTEHNQSALQSVYLRLWVAVGIISSLVILTGYLSYLGFIKTQQTIATQAVDTASQRLLQHLADQRDRMRLLTLSHRDEVLRLIHSPQDQGAYRALAAYVAEYFPGYFAFTISDPRGERLYHDDFGESIGEMCRTDIRQYANKEFTQSIYIHPGPDVYHFDLMHIINDDAGAVIGVFYVSILPDGIRDILRSDQPIGQSLYLLRSDGDGLIDVSAEGARDAIVRDTRLKADEINSVLARIDLPGTRWQLIAIPIASHYQARLHRIGLLTGMALLAVLLIAALAMVYLKRAHQGLRQTQDMYRTLVTNVEGVVWQANAAPFRFSYISPQLQQLFGHSPESWLANAEAWFGAVHDADRDNLRRMLAAAADGQSVDIEFRLKTPAGRYVWVRDQVRQETGPDGGRRLTGIMTDVTHHHDNEERLREQARQLQVYNEELESFSYSVSHDLRGPLRSINGYSQIIAEDYAESLDDHGKGMLRRISAASQRMGELIDALLELSRVGRAALNPQRFNLSDTVWSVCHDLEQQMPARHVEWQVQPDIQVYGDPALLRVVMQNLLENAWKFTAKVESPRISIEAQRTDNVVDITVRDNGVGCDMQFAGKLFKPFQRLHDDTQFEGTGIGLATVKRIIDRHHGEIRLHCEPDKGAAISFTLAAGEIDL